VQIVSEAYRANGGDMLCAPQIVYHIFTWLSISPTRIDTVACLLLAIS
jgi:hypothetical protein